MLYWGTKKEEVLKCCTCVPFCLPVVEGIWHRRAGEQKKHARGGAVEPVHGRKHNYSYIARTCSRSQTQQLYC